LCQDKKVKKEKAIVFAFLPLLVFSTNNRFEELLKFISFPLANPIVENRNRGSINEISLPT